MDRVAFNSLCQSNGSQDKQEGERWKDILHMSLKHGRHISRFQDKVTKDQILYVDKEVTVGSETTRLTGFYVLENMPNEVAFENNGPFLSFVPIEIVESVTFLNVNNISKLTGNV